MTEDLPEALEPTGERLLPEAYAGELVVAEHVARYLVAARLASGRRVLDAACGEGYGSAILAAAGAQSVTGVDIDEATVEHARARYGLDARVGDVTALPFEDAAFDLVVSFETIEHVAVPRRALAEFARVLAPGGSLFVSTPNANEYLEDNPYHLSELPPDEFLGALRESFREVRPLYQQNFLASLITDEAVLELEDRDVELRPDVRKLTGVAPGHELYTLALCTHGDGPALTADMAVLSGVYEAHRLADQLRNAIEHQRLWHAEVEAAQRIHRALEARASQAEENQTAWEERATEAERLQEAWQERATEAERQNAMLLAHNDKLRAALARIRGSLLWRVTRPVRQLAGLRDRNDRSANPSHTEDG